MTDRPKILIVDDKPQNLFALEKTLEKLDVEVFKATLGNEALALTLEHDFCLALVDVQMPEMDGYELVELMRGNTVTASLPVIFVSAIYSDEYHHRKAYDSGAVDFLTKPFIPEILLSKVRVFINLYQQRQKLQDLTKELSHTNSILSRHTTLLETSSTIGQQIASILDIKELLSQVTTIIEKQFNYSWVRIWLLNEDETSLELEVRPADKLADGTCIPVDHKGLVGQAYRTAKIALDNKAGKNQSFIPTPGMSTIFSEIAVPLNFGKRTLGVLDIQSERFEAFFTADEAALKMLSAQLAVAIRNASLYSEVVRLNEEHGLAKSRKR